MEEIIDNIPEQQVYDVIVIGAGAAGMMAAGTAARNGKENRNLPLLAVAWVQHPLLVV